MSGASVHLMGCAEVRHVDYPGGWGVAIAPRGARLDELVAWLRRAPPVARIAALAAHRRALKKRRR